MSKKKHADYWKARQEDILRYLDKADIDVSAELSGLYSEQAVEAQKDLYNLYMKYAKDNNLTYQEAQQRLRHEDLSDYRKNAERYRKQAEKDPELLKRLNEQYVSARATRLDALALEMTFRAGVLRGLIDKTFEKYLKNSASYAYSKAVGGRAGTINAPALKQLIETPFNGYNYSQQVWGHVDNLAKDLKEVLKRGFVRGDGVRELAREISKKYEVARHRAETLIRTDGTMVINNATAKRYMDEGLRYYRDLVQLDNRTTKICREVARKDERKLLSEMQPGINAAPYHFNCRTTIVPDDEELNYDIDLRLSQARKHGDKVMITDVSVGKIPEIQIPGYSKLEAANIQLAHKQLLKEARDLNSSNEVMYILLGENPVRIFGDQWGVDANTSNDARFLLNSSKPRSLTVLHNHPGGSTFSLNDFNFFMGTPSVKTLTIVSNTGRVMYVTKTDSYDFSGAVNELSKVRVGDDISVEKLFKKLYNYGIRYKLK